MKKNIFKIIILIPLLGLTFGCQGFLDLTPSHQLVKDNALQTIEDYEGALTGAYNAVIFGGYYGANYLAMPEYMADNVSRTAELFSGQDDTDNWLASPFATRIDDIWSDIYTVINRANTVINNIEGLQETTAGQKNRILGQALALRAMAHFDLLRFFGQEYDRNSTKLGVMIRTQNDLTYPARSTVKETYDQIFADLTQASTLLATVDKAINTATAKYYLDINGVNALTARVALYAGDYAKARDAATAVISATGFGLAPRNDFAQIWEADLPLNEVIWSARIQPGGIRVAADLYFVPGNFNTFAPATGLIALYDQANDVRYNTYIKNRASAPAGSPLVVVGKYLGRLPLRDGINDNKVFRVSEMLLTRAEANAQLAQDAAAMADLNTLRAARIANYVNENLTGVNLKNAIQVERRKELAFDGHRWFDLRRAKLPVARSECKTPCLNGFLAADSPRFILPIPQSEITANKQAQQNEGY
jgi:hypothetical protein